MSAALGDQQPDDRGGAVGSWPEQQRRAALLRGRVDVGAVVNSRRTFFRSVIDHISAVELKAFLA